jgi:hypothetical protein
MLYQLSYLGVASPSRDRGKQRSLIEAWSGTVQTGEEKKSDSDKGVAAHGG